MRRQNCRHNSFENDFHKNCLKTAFKSPPPELPYYFTRIPVVSVLNGTQCDGFSAVYEL